MGVVALTVLALFYLGVYRPTHSPFSGWWTCALICAAASAVLLLGDETTAQVVTNPASTVASALGAVCVWFATRSLRRRSNPGWVLIVAPVVCLVAAVLDHPSTNIWAGNGVLFVVMALGFSASAVEVWRTWAQRRSQSDAQESREAITALAVSGIAATTLAALFTLRVALYLGVGHDDALFTHAVGPAATWVVMLICLVAVTFSVSAIGWDQRTRELRRQAAEDDLTGLLGRTAFLLRAQAAIANSGGRRAAQAWLVIADLDDFKPINDEYGHQAGDRTLQAFADVARGALRASDAIGRLGGDEFGIVMENLEEAGVVARLEEIRRRLALQPDAAGHELPTVSFGVAQCFPDLTLSEMLGRADAALYEAKDAGRDTVAVFEDRDPVP